jgi:hypothetical protein
MYLCGLLFLHSPPRTFTPGLALDRLLSWRLVGLRGQFDSLARLPADLVRTF